MQIRELHNYTRRRWGIVLNVSMIFCTVSFFLPSCMLQAICDLTCRGQSMLPVEQAAAVSFHLPFTPCMHSNAPPSMDASGVHANRQSMCACACGRWCMW